MARDGAFVVSESAHGFHSVPPIDDVHPTNPATRNGDDAERCGVELLDDGLDLALLQHFSLHAAVHIELVDWNILGGVRLVRQHRRHLISHRFLFSSV
jgi:hypothetical protein